MTNTTALKKYFTLQDEVKGANELKIEAYYYKGSGFVMSANIVKRSRTEGGFSSELYPDMMNNIYERIMPCNRISPKALEAARAIAENRVAAVIAAVIAASEARFNCKVITSL